MKLPQPLLAGRLLRRYQRFFAEVELEDGRVVTAHTPNTGSMQQCAVAGHRVLLSPSRNPARKLAYTWELVEVNGHWVDVNTQRANRVVEEALRTGQIGTFAGGTVRPEFPWGASRFDFLVERQAERTLLEVKNVTLCCADAVACFPDAVTERGQKHLRELLQAKGEGWRTAVLFLVQRGEAEAFTPADAIDPEYGRLLRAAVAGGVEALACRTLVTPAEVTIDRELALIL
ncbi:MAG: DNA/RNA nuclease SfsA [Deltaproteobacteria bacterium]|nr:MAG: DNA/RNA nuclease SfsA [Deltaproteobacteria bacterium]